MMRKSHQLKDDNDENNNDDGNNIDSETMHQHQQHHQLSIIDSNRYYATYSGHETLYLHSILHDIRGDRQVIWFAGDSSLDNKYWFHNQAAALNGYEKVLLPPIMKQDVCYWLNREIVERKLGDSYLCMNTAVEASSLNSRPFCTLLAQDRFIRDNIRKDDYLIVSIGGNDIALSPTLMTILNICALVCCTPTMCLRQCTCACPPNSHIDAGCFCCGCDGCLSSTMCGWPLGFGYFVDMFKNKVGNYVRKIVRKTKPKKVLVCMIYYPDELAGGSWADGSLAALCYNANPGKLQLMISKVFEHATKQIHIDGVEVVPFPLFEIMNGSDSSDYIQRVEPSPVGGRKMATAFLNTVLQ